MFVTSRKISFARTGAILGAIVTPELLLIRHLPLFKITLAFNNKIPIPRRWAQFPPHFVRQFHVKLNCQTILAHHWRQLYT